MKRKGFTLIELLAVIVILAIIALIAVPQILGVIEKSRKGAAEVSALGYIDAVEKYMIMHDIDSSKYPYDLKNNTWNIADSTNVAFLDLFVEKVNAESTVPALNTFINVKGTKPTSGTITTNDKEVTSATLVVNSYNVICIGESCNVEGKSETPTPTPVITTNSVMITKDGNDAGSSIEIVEGESITLGALVTLSNNETNNNVTWTKEGESINISSSGVITTNSVGTSIVTATSGDKSDSITINVKLNGVSVTNFAVGDYVQMTPSYVGSYTPTTNSSSQYYTGIDTPGSITPSELTKWVVIKNDGTNIEMISLYASSTKITFRGQVGFKNIVGALNKISEQYQNSKFTNGSRHMGYSPGNSVEQCSDLCSGDTYYEADVSLVKAAMNDTLNATDFNGTNAEYYLASRITPWHGTMYSYDCRYVSSSGTITWNYLTDNCNSSIAISSSYSIRPILYLKPDVVADPSGDGSANNPWVLIEQ